MNDQELSQHELFPAIAREPLSDEARLVLADALIEAGDPRGDLITMQSACPAWRGSCSSATR